MKDKITLNETIREAISIALIHLMKTKSFSEISISEITRVAGVSRSSFYRNFDSIEDVAVGYINRIYREYFKEKPVNPNSYKKSAFLPFLKERYVFIEQHKDVFRVLYKNGILYSTLMKMDSETKKQFLIADIDESRYFSAMIMSFSAGVIEEWVAGGMKESPGELSEITKRCLMGMFIRLKDTF